MNNDEHLRYPIGRFSAKESYTLEEVLANIQRIETAPAKIESAFKSLHGTQLDTPYRAGSWTARQVIHHVADSHLNAYIRCKWTLTEGTPVIKAYDEKAWAETGEIKADPAISMALLNALHTKWTILLKSLSADDLKKSFIHPDSKKTIRIDQLIATYAWHGEHHLGHLTIIAAK